MAEAPRPRRSSAASASPSRMGSGCLGNPHQRGPRRRRVGAPTASSSSSPPASTPRRHRVRGHRQGRRQEGHLLLPGAHRRPGFRSPHRGEDGGQHASDTTQILFEDCRIPAGLGGRREARATRSPCPTSRPAASASPPSAIGMARARWRRRALRQERESFGKPIFRSTRRSTSASPTWPPSSTPRARCGAPPAQGRRQALPQRRRRWPRCSPPRWPRRRCSDAIQIHGGYGYVTDFPVERIYRDVRVCQILVIFRWS